MKSMIRPAFLTLLVLSSLSISFACAETGSETVPVDTADLVEGYNRFGIDLFVREAASGDGENIFVSPVSVSLCLGMAYNGAGGSTATEMAGILGADSFPLAGYNTANGTLVAGLSDTGAGMTLNIAIGQQTPPVASVLVTSCSIAKTDIWETTKVNIPFIMVLAGVLMLVTYFPPVSLTLVNFFYG